QVSQLKLSKHAGLQLHVATLSLHLERDQGECCYNCDLEFVAATMTEVAERQVGEEMMKQVQVFREILAQTPVNQLEVQERPVVMFRVSENTWLEAIVRYLVQPKEAGRVKTRMIKELLVRLNAEPDRVMFPKGSAR